MEVFFTDMLQYDPVTEKKRAVERHGPNPCWSRARRYKMEAYRSWSLNLPWRETFNDFQLRRDALKQGVELTSYDVSMYSESCIGKIAASQTFFCCTMFVVLLNAIWLWYDADKNTAVSISKAELQFVIVENLFCIIFSLEVVVRFAAFKHKRDCLDDYWFLFEAVLVFFMIIEIWLLPLYYVWAGI